MYFIFQQLVIFTIKYEILEIISDNAVVLKIIFFPFALIHRGLPALCASRWPFSLELVTTILSYC